MPNGTTGILASLDLG
ncbi:Protein of unknown function [Pyronema omphalodes CBS 100304]|uniref:Uncharacterized protein n=1 Tax=Pyronema omphalodes (strain CBS 100304) TaxID=1076935 RepID=U4LJL4_PYROM|nr:Protein of unknown function [Pyronema omphalodes CBS 100304]